MFIGKVNIKLLLPLKWDEKELKEIELDFSRVTGALINKCNRETFNNEGNVSVAVLPAQTPEYCARLAAGISDVPFRAFEKMNGYDYETVCHTVGAFVNKRNPQKFYDEYVKARDGEDEDEGFTSPAQISKPA